VRSRLFILTACLGAFSLSAHEYFEGFDAPGKPAGRDGITWNYTAELSPADWKALIPGDGYAHLSVERSALKDPPKGTWPFQTLSLGPVTSNNRISNREKNKLDEIDIEIVADDTQGPHTGHKTGPDGGWTDVRLNTWTNANANTLLPTRSIRTPIKDAHGRKISHQDGRFHIYTIEWESEVVRFYIDGVMQSFIDDIAPDRLSTVIFGMRQMPWAGTPDWSGRRTMLVDWIDIEPLGR
jgi:hypothetical protein